MQARARFVQLEQSAWLRERTAAWHHQHHTECPPALPQKSLHHQVLTAPKLCPVQGIVGCGHSIGEHRPSACFMASRPLDGRCGSGVVGGVVRLGRIGVLGVDSGLPRIAIIGQPPRAVARRGGRYLPGLAAPTPKPRRAAGGSTPAPGGVRSLAGRRQALRVTCTANRPTQVPRPRDSGSIAASHLVMAHAK